MRRLTKVAAGVLAFLLLGQPARAEEPAFVTLGAGIFDINDSFTTAQVNAEYRFAEKHKLWVFTPFVGLLGTAEGSAYGYAGIGLDLFFGKHFVVTPNFAFGAYGKGSGKDLGGTLEFRSGIELAYRMEDYSRIGIHFSHISNANTGFDNPGTESLILTWSTPF